MSDIVFDGTYTASQLKQAFLILAAAGRLDEFEKACNDRGLKIHVSESDRDFIRDELNNIVSQLILKHTNTDRTLVAHQGCPC